MWILLVQVNFVKLFYFYFKLIFQLRALMLLLEKVSMEPLYHLLKTTSSSFVNYDSWGDYTNT